MDKTIHIAKSIKSIVAKKAPLAKVYLYGSRIRGTANQDSDWDVLILLTREITAEIEEEITSPLYDLELDTGEVISPMIYNEKEWNTKYRIRSFYHNVMREGKLLWQPINQMTLKKNNHKGTSINSNNNLTARFAKKSQCSQCADF